MLYSLKDRLSSKGAAGAETVEPVQLWNIKQNHEKANSRRVHAFSHFAAEEVSTADAT
jgi:hypothetical protein